MKSLTELLNNNHNIVINTDIDGILSGLLLVKYCSCKIVGFTNSKDKVWLTDEDENKYNDLYANIYVDMFVPDATCIDQHIVALDDNHMQSIRNSERIYSPQSDDENSLRMFTKDGFANKYPFGTFQYVLAKLEAEDIEIDLPDLDTKLKNLKDGLTDDSDIKIGDLLNRPDDAMATTIYAYCDNAKKWWDWLLKLSKKDNGSIKKLKDYLDKLSNISIEKVDKMPPKWKKHTAEEYKNHKKKDVEEIKEKTKEYFYKNFGCRSGDGGFNMITDINGNLSREFSLYLNSIASLLGFNLDKIPNHFITHTGKYCRTTWLDIFPKLTPKYNFFGHKIFSYAFIFGPDDNGKNGKQNFSFTIDME